MAELSVAVVGCGGIGQIHLQVWSSFTGVRISAVCDRDPLVVARAAATYGNPDAFTDYRRLLTGAAYDIVDICEPSALHLEIGQAALRAGANVLCETPMTADSASARTLLRLAAERERLVLPALFRRFDPAVGFLKELLDNDDLGRPTMFRCRLTESPSNLKTAPDSGALLNTTLHGLDLFRALCGEATRAVGAVRRLQPELEVEDTAVALVEGARTLGVVEAAWNPLGANTVLEVYGTAGACLIDFNAALTRYLTADHPVWQTREESGPGRFERFFAHAADVIRGLQAPLVSGEDALRALELVEAIREGREGPQAEG